DANFSHRTTLGRGYIHCWGRAKARVHQERCVLVSEVGWRAPVSVGFNLNERLIRPRLYPPGSAPRIHDDAMSGTGTNGTSRDVVNSLPASLRSWRNLDEFNRWF